MSHDLGVGLHFDEAWQGAIHSLIPYQANAFYLRSDQLTAQISARARAAIEDRRWVTIGQEATEKAALFKDRQRHEEALLRAALTVLATQKPTDAVTVAKLVAAVTAANNTDAMADDTQGKEEDGDLLSFRDLAQRVERGIDELHARLEARSLILENINSSIIVIILISIFSFVADTQDSMISVLALFAIAAAGTLSAIPVRKLISRIVADTSR